MTQELSRKEWLERRRKYIGGSDAAAVLGMSPWRTRLQLCRDKWGLEEDKPTEVMIRGQMLEPLVAYLYEQETRHLVKPGKWVLSKDHYFMADTPDLIDQVVDTIVQCKTSSTWGRHRWGDPGTEAIPDDYKIQGQHEMAVTGSPANVFAVLFADENTFRALQSMVKAKVSVETIAKFIAELRGIPDAKCEFSMFPLMRNDKTIASIIAAEKQFWETYVVPKVCPPDASIPEKTTDIVVADRVQTKLMEGYRDAREERKLAEGKMAEWRMQIETAIGDNAGITANGVGKITFRAPTPKKKTDHESLALKMRPSDPEAYDIYLAKYTKEVQGARSFCATFKK